MHEQLDINGKIPALTGLVCQELLCQQYWYKGQLEEEANIIYLKFGDVWHRLYFDCSMIFWRSNDSTPVNYQLKDEGYNYPIVDLAQKFDLKGVMFGATKCKIH